MALGERLQRLQLFLRLKSILERTIGTFQTIFIYTGKRPQPAWNKAFSVNVPLVPLRLVPLFLLVPHVL
jgi:hypothetical protein